MRTIKQTLLLAALVSPALAGTAHAGDFATRAILGFSEDGSRFAFEEYGTQDGSGFPYSNIYVIDTATDQWTAGSPFRVLMQDENATEEDARDQARAEAGSALTAITQPGVHAATNQPLEIVDNPHRMAAKPYVFNPPTSDSIEFRIEEIPVMPPEMCKDFGETMAFRLKQIFSEPGKATRLLHEDNGVPSSRRCPLSYRFADILTYYPDNGPPVAAILILMEQVGFEGPDGRYLAVTTQLD
jgi:predicted secreted protein